MDQIAIISDIHGNLEALKTVLKDIHKRDIQHICCLGDIIAKGNHAKECVDLIMDECEVVLKGNCEDYFMQSRDVSLLDDKEKARVIWNQKQFSLKQQSMLFHLPTIHEFYLSGRLVRLFHATPHNLYKSVGNIDSLNNIKEMFMPTVDTLDKYADIVVYGHIHLPYMQKVYNRILLNAGSVGNGIDIYRDSDFDGPLPQTVSATYLILKGQYNSKQFDTIGYEFVSIPYNIDKELSDLENNIEPQAYENELRSGYYRDHDKIKDLIR